MSYRKLLVGLADPGIAPRVMAAAGTLAAEHEAHLVAVHVVPTGTTHEDGMSTSDRVERLRAIYEVYRDDDAYTSEWLTIDHTPLSVAGVLVELGNACDALVLGQRHAHEAGRSGRHLGEHVVGVTARPVLLVPEAGDTPFAAARVLLAWDGSALATRTAFDALPLLQHADNVQVHRFNSPTDERHHVSGATEGFAEALSRHGVSVEVSRSDASRLDIGAKLLSLAAETSADLLLMGCRPHSRVRQFLLGDTTRHVFAHSTGPVLMGN